MKTQDLLTDSELRARVAEAAGDLRSQAEADEGALGVEVDDYKTELAASAASEVVAAEPALAGVQLDNGVAGDNLDAGATTYEQAFHGAQRQVLATLAQGVDGYLGVVIQEAIDVIDALRAEADAIGTEAAQLSLAAASGQLVPVTQDSVESFQDEVETARDQAVLVQREVQNLQARRRARRVADGDENQPDEYPTARSLDGRVLVRSPESGEMTDRDDQGHSLVQGRPGQTRTSIASEQNQQLQALLRAPALTRIHYLAICAAVAAMNRAKASREQSQTLVGKLRSIYAAIRHLLSGNFIDDLQDNLEARAGAAVGNALAMVQRRLDAADDFLQAVSRLPGPFVSTVLAIGDQPDTAPVIDSIAALCGLKADKLCDMTGLLEIAKSLDVEFGLTIPKPPMIGRARLTLDPPEESQAPAPVTVPGQEADLLLVGIAANQVTARFSRQDAPTRYDAGSQSFQEVADVFGTGDGKLIVLGDGQRQDEEITYSQVTFNPATGNYVFALASTPTATVPVVRGQGEPVVLSGLTGPAAGASATTPPNSWNDTILFPVGATVITLRVPEAQARDITLPCDLALGFGEQTVAAGDYDASVANTVRALSGAPFASWMVGLPIDLGPATANGVAARRTIAMFVDANTITYSGADVPGTPRTVNGTPTGPRNSFRLTADTFEIVRATAMANGPHTDLKAFTLQTPTTRPHRRMLAIPQMAVRVVPTVRDTNLTSSLTPADPNVRDLDILPAGSTVLSATYVDVTQDTYFTPILTAKGSGSVYVDSQGPFTYTLVTDGAGATLRFTLAAATPQAFAAGVLVEVETTSLLSQFAIDFPDTWFDPLDDWLLDLGAELTRLEAKFCRLLSGSSQDVAASAAALATLASSISLTLTTARFALVAWLVPLVQANSMTRAMAQLETVGAHRAARKLREGNVGEFSAMTPAEGNDAGATLIVAQSYQDRVVTDEQYRVLAKAVAEVRARHDAQAAAAAIVGDLKAAQAAELERRQAGARRLEVLQEQLP